MAQITEVAPDLFRITTFLEPFNLQFSQVPQGGTVNATVKANKEN